MSVCLRQVAKQKYVTHIEHGTKSSYCNLIPGCPTSKTRQLCSQLTDVWLWLINDSWIWLVSQVCVKPVLAVCKHADLNYFPFM